MPNESEECKNSSIEEITLKSWEEFEDVISKEYRSLAELKNNNSVSNLLFRGQVKNFWRLETTLERYVREKNVPKKEYSWIDYWDILRSIKPAIYSLAEYKPEFEEFSNSQVSRVPSCYDFMIYIRHHGFPSPLLDWTRSPYVAAYFAFNDSKEDDVAIYSYLEYAEGAKLTTSSKPEIAGLGSYAETHKRHYQQQCEYTVCFKEIWGKDYKKVYTSHEKVEFGTGQDILKKYILPAKERKIVMEKLRLMNINAFSLFGDEEGLMSMLADLEIEKER